MKGKYVLFTENASKLLLNNRMPRNQVFSHATRNKPTNYSDFREMIQRAFIIHSYTHMHTSQ